MFVVNAKNDMRRAIARAVEARPEVLTHSFSDYSVEGSEGNYYRVTIRQFGHCLGVDCACTGGQFGNACYHAAAALAEHTRLVITGAAAPAPARDRNLTYVESDLRAIRRAAESSRDFETADEIQRAVRSALQALGEYELGLLPKVGSAAA